MSADRKPRFLFILPWSVLAPGGVNQVVMNLYRECRRSSDFEPMILILDWEHPTAEAKMAGEFQCVHLRVPAPIDDVTNLRVLLGFLRRVPVTLWRLRKLLRQHNVQVVNAHYPTLAIGHFVLLKLLGLFGSRRLILSFHGLDIRKAAKSQGVRKRLWLNLLRHADSVVCCSDALARDVAGFAREASHKVRAIRNGVDVERIRGEVAGAGSAQAPGRPYILTIGAFEHKKGLDVLVNAFADLAPEFPTVDLRILGREGSARPALEDLIRRRGLGDRVTCRVDVPHPEALRQLRDAMLLALPSRSEPLGIAILEAGALRVPVVASRVDGIPEIVVSADLGSLVEPEDERGLAEALRALLRDRILRDRLGLALHEHVAAKFAWRRAWAEYATLVAECVGASFAADTLSEQHPTKCQHDESSTSRSY